MVRNIIVILCALPVILLIGGVSFYLTFRDDITRTVQRTVSGRVSEADSLIGQEIPERHLEIRQVWTKIDPDDDDHAEKIVKQVLIDAFDGRLEKLEEQAREYRETDARLPNGARKIEALYDAFGNYSDWNQADPERWYDKLISRLEEWRDQYPESPTPHIALAGLYIDYAWWARGSGWANTVTEEQWETFRDRLQRTRGILRNAPPEVWQDPQSYKYRMTAGLGLRYERAEMQELFDAAQKIAPLDPEIYGRMTYYLAPRWFGNTHRDWHDWLVEALSRVENPDDADALYARVVMNSFWRYDDQEEPHIYSDTGADWERVKRGAWIWHERYPEASSTLSDFLKLAVSAQDWATVGEIVEKMGHKFNSRSFHQYYDADFYDMILYLQEEGHIPPQI